MPHNSNNSRTHPCNLIYVRPDVYRRALGVPHTVLPVYFVCCSPLLILAWKSSDRGSDRETSRPGKRLQQKLLDDLRRTVVVTHFVHQLTKTAADDALDQVVSRDEVDTTYI